MEHLTAVYGVYNGLFRSKIYYRHIWSAILHQFVCKKRILPLRSANYGQIWSVYVRILVKLQTKWSLTYTTDKFGTRHDKKWYMQGMQKLINTELHNSYYRQIWSVYVKYVLNYGRNGVCEELRTNMEQYEIKKWHMKNWKKLINTGM